LARKGGQTSVRGGDIRAKEDQLEQVALILERRAERTVSMAQLQAFTAAETSTPPSHAEAAAAEVKKVMEEVETRMIRESEGAASDGKTQPGEEAAARRRRRRWRGRRRRRSRRRQPPRPSPARRSEVHVHVHVSDRERDRGRASPVDRDDRLEPQPDDLGVGQSTGFDPGHRKF